MSLIEKLLKDELATFWNKEMIPLAEKLQNNGKSFFSLHPDQIPESYFLQRDKKTMAKEDFEAFGDADFDLLLGALEQMWLEQGLYELASLSPSLKNIGAQLQKDQEKSKEESLDINPLIYQMY